MLTSALSHPTTHLHRVEICKRIRGTPGDNVKYRNHEETQHVLVALSDDMYWLAGDNPRNSHDSRNYGPVPRKLIKGRVTHRLSRSFPFLVPMSTDVPESTLQVEQAILDYRSPTLHFIRSEDRVYEQQVINEQLERIQRYQQRAREEERAKVPEKAAGGEADVKESVEDA